MKTNDLLAILFGCLTLAVIIGLMSSCSIQCTKAMAEVHEYWEGGLRITMPEKSPDKNK